MTKYLIFMTLFLSQLRLLVEVVGDNAAATVVGRAGWSSNRRNG